MFHLFQKTQGEWQVVMMITAAILVAGSVLFCLLAKGEVSEGIGLDGRKKGGGVYCTCLI